MQGAAEIRDGQRRKWAALSAGWEKWDSIIMDQLAPVSAAIIESLHLTSAQHHLDVASGTGEPGLTIAKLSSLGRVVLSDLSADMLSVAARRAAAQGISTIETHVCSADDLPFDDATFDSAAVRFGYMFFPDPAKATAEFRRVLKPGGRVAAAVWAPPADNPWTTIIMDAVATEIEVPPPDPDVPNMYRCAASGCISTLYEEAGLRDVTEFDVPVELVTDSLDQWWEMTSEHISAAAAALQQVDEAARGRIRAHATAAVGRYVTEGKVRVPGLARCIAATRV
jgi:ubiquinone/menaquinone biosynthesis C-methylase UbiE